MDRYDYKELRSKIMKRLYGCMALMAIMSINSITFGMLDDPVRTDFTQPDKELVILVSNDGIGFLVSTEYAKASQTLKDLIQDAGIANPIPLPPISGRTLERILKVVVDNQVPVDLSLQDLIALLEAENYLDVLKAKAPLYETIADRLTFNEEDLVALFNNPQIPSPYKEAIIRLFAPRVAKDPKVWTREFLQAFLGYEKLARPYVIRIMQELINNNRSQLIEVVKDYNIHAKELRKRGLDPMESAYFRIETTAEEKALHGFLKSLLGADYMVIKTNLEKEYPQEL